jgi:hypothetical protein
MRTRLLALPLLAATLLAVTGARPAAPVASGPTPSPCRANEIPVRGRALDGGTGCVDPRAPESPADMLLTKAVFDGPRAGLDGSERLHALRTAQALRAEAEARRSATGSRDFAAADGTSVPDSGSKWRPLGPSPLVVNNPDYPGGNGYGVDKVAGRVSVLVTDPRDATGQTLYAGFAGGGVWKSTTGGDSWVSIGDPLPSQAVGGMALNADGWLFVGLGEGNTGSDNYAGAGVVMSKDDGATWSGLLGPGVIPAGVVTTHIAIGGDSVYVATQKGLFYSNDKGTTWKRAILPTAGSGESTKAFGNFVTDVRVHPDHPERVTAAVGWRSGGIQPAPGLYRSTDSGATWTKMTATGFGSGSVSTDPIGRVSLAYYDGPDASLHDHLYAVIQDAGKLNNEPFPVASPLPPQANTNNLNGIYRSPDDGNTWVLLANNTTLGAAPGSGISTTNIPLNGNYGPGVQAWYNNYIIVEPTAPVVAGGPNEVRLIVGLEEIYQGTVVEPIGKASAWQTIGRYWNACVQVVVAQLNCADLGIPTYSGLTTHADQHAAAFAKTANGYRIYVGNDGGVYRQDASADGFHNNAWTSLNDGLNTTMPYAAAMGHDGVVYTGLQDNGTARIGADGKAYEAIGGDGFDVAVDPQDSDVAYEEYAGGVLRVTQNGGVSWSGDVSPTAKTGQRFSTPFELDPTDPEHFVYGGSQVWENTSAPAITAANWTKVFDVTNAETAPAAAVTAIDVRGPAVYAAWCGLPASPPAGASACNITTGDGDYDPTLFRRGLATNVKPGCTAAKASTDCWHQVAAAGLPNRFIQGVTIDPNDPKIVYVAVASFSRHWTYDPASFQPGVIFKSVDGGNTFTNISGNLPQVFGSDPLVVGDRLLVATDVGIFGTSRKSPGAWVPFGTDIPEAVPAIEISTNPQQTKLVAATHGRGVWVLDLTGKNNGGGGSGGGSGGGGGNGGGGGGGVIPTTGLPGWVMLAPLPLLLAVLARRRLRAARG